MVSIPSSISIISNANNNTLDISAIPYLTPSRRSLSLRAKRIKGGCSDVPLTVRLPAIVDGVYVGVLKLNN